MSSATLVVFRGNNFVFVSALLREQLFESDDAGEDQSNLGDEESLQCQESQTFQRQRQVTSGDQFPQQQVRQQLLPLLPRWKQSRIVTADGTSGNRDLLL